MKLQDIQKTETKLFEVLAEIVEDKHVYIKVTTEDYSKESTLPLTEDTYWEWDDIWGEVIDFHCENCDDPTYWHSDERVRPLIRFNRKLWDVCGVRG